MPAGRVSHTGLVRAGDALATVSRRSALLGGLGLCALTAWPAVDAALHGGGPGRETDSAAVRHEIDPQGIVRVRTARRMVALTFDDGPDPRFTPAVLDALAAYGFRATFFAVGRNLVAYPDLAARIVREGHHVANHTFDHLWLDRLDEASLTRELVGGRAAAARFDLGGSRFVRPPRGWTSRGVARRTSQLGQQTVFWSACVESALRDGPDAGERVGDRLRPGDVLLAHDGGRITGPNAQDLDRSATVAALPALFETLRRRGVNGVPVQELVAS
jgi:peptidoglycan/xylan/chitin deacetylase (PgdA/CDA1 family)